MCLGSPPTTMCLCVCVTNSLSWFLSSEGLSRALRQMWWKQDILRRNGNIFDEGKGAPVTLSSPYYLRKRNRKGGHLGTATSYLWRLLDSISKMSSAVLGIDWGTANSTVIFFFLFPSLSKQTKRKCLVKRKNKKETSPFGLNFYLKRVNSPINMTSNTLIELPA